jgi:methylated-DNA-protein-cysteine methyltransferase-like protein
MTRSAGRGLRRLARIFTAMKKPASPASTTASAGPAPERNYFADVHEVVRLVPPGRVTNYGAIAHYLGAKHGSRAVGYALMAANLDAMTLNNDAPVPAHRVVNRLGHLTGRHHFPTPTAMQERLEAEGVRVEDDVVVDFKKLYWDPAVELG